MTITSANAPTLRKPLRLWPGVSIAIVVALTRYVIPAVAPDADIFGFPLAMLGVLVGTLGAVLIVLWWLLFSRARWQERVGALAVLPCWAERKAVDVAATATARPAMNRPFVMPRYRPLQST